MVNMSRLSRERSADVALAGLPVLYGVIMKTYVPELVNELTRIVVTTRNDNPSVEEYDAVVPGEWRRCQEVQAVVEAGQTPGVGQLRAVLVAVLVMLRAKRVPEAEIRERVDEAFARCRQGLYPVDRAGVEDGAWEASRRQSSGGGR